MRENEEKFKIWVKYLVNDKLKELSNILIVQSSPVFMPSSLLGLRFQALVEQIDKCKTNTIEVQKVLTTKNSEIEETQRKLKLEIHKNHESFQSGIQDLNTTVTRLSSSHSSLLPPPHLQAQMRDMEERIKRQAQETIHTQRTNMEQNIQHQIEAQHGQNPKIQYQIAELNASISQMQGEITAVQLKGDYFSSGLMGAPPSVGADCTPQPPPVEVTLQFNAKVDTVHKQTQELRNNHQKVNASLSSLLACVSEWEAWATETNVEFQTFVARADETEEWVKGVETHQHHRCASKAIQDTHSKQIEETTKTMGSEHERMSALEGSIATDHESLAKVILHLDDAKDSMGELSMRTTLVESCVGDAGEHLQNVARHVVDVPALQNNGEMKAQRLVQQATQTSEHRLNASLEAHWVSTREALHRLEMQSASASETQSISIREEIAMWEQKLNEAVVSHKQSRQETLNRMQEMEKGVGRHRSAVVGSLSKVVGHVSSRSLCGEGSKRRYAGWGNASAGRG